MSVESRHGPGTKRCGLSPDIFGHARTHQGAACSHPSAVLTFNRARSSSNSLANGLPLWGLLLLLLLLPAATLEADVADECEAEVPSTALVLPALPVALLFDLGGTGGAGNTGLISGGGGERKGFGSSSPSKSRSGPSRLEVAMAPVVRLYHLLKRGDTAALKLETVLTAIDFCQQSKQLLLYSRLPHQAFYKQRQVRGKKTPGNNSSFRWPIKELRLSSGPFLIFPIFLSSSPAQEARGLVGPTRTLLHLPFPVPAY